MENPTYLGDGLYTEYDGFGIWLLANHHLHPTDKVYLEPAVYDNLTRFVKEMKEVTDATE